MNTLEGIIAFVVALMTMLTDPYPPGKTSELWITPSMICDSPTDLVQYLERPYIERMQGTTCGWSNKEYRAKVTWLPRIEVNGYQYKPIKIEYLNKVPWLPVQYSYWQQPIFVGFKA